MNTFYHEWFQQKYGIGIGDRVHVTQFEGAIDRGLGTVADVWEGAASGKAYALVNLDAGGADTIVLSPKQAVNRNIKKGK